MIDNPVENEEDVSNQQLETSQQNIDGKSIEKNQKDCEIDITKQNQNKQNGDIEINQSQVTIDKNTEMTEKIANEENIVKDTLNIERNERKDDDNANETNTESNKNSNEIILIQESNSNQIINNNISKESENKEKKLKSQSNTSSSQKNQKRIFFTNSNNYNPDNKNAKKAQRITKSHSQGAVYNHTQNSRSPTITSKNASSIGNDRKGKIPYSMTSPSNIRFRNNKNDLFERSLKKPVNSDEDSDDYLNFTFTYSNPYYGSNKKPITSDITSESNIIKEIQKRKMREEKDEEIDEEMKNQFKISDYNKKLAKRALMKKNERRVKRIDTSNNNNNEEDQDIIFLDDQILPDDTEIESKKRKYSRKMPSYLSQVSSFLKDHKDVIKVTKEQEMEKLRKSRK